MNLNKKISVQSNVQNHASSTLLLCLSIRVENPQKCQCCIRDSGFRYCSQTSCRFPRWLTPRLLQNGETILSKMFGGWKKVVVNLEIVFRVRVRVVRVVRAKPCA